MEANQVVALEIADLASNHPVFKLLVTLAARSVRMMTSLGQYRMPCIIKSQRYGLRQKVQIKEDLVCIVEAAIS